MEKSVCVSVYAPTGVSATISDGFDTGGGRVLNIHIDAGIPCCNDELCTGVNCKGNAASGAEFDPVAD